MLLGIILISVFVSGAAAFLLHPMPSVKTTSVPPPQPQPEPEPPYDPSAFWLYPDWDSGPPEQPFWMRPLKGPVVRDMAWENYGNRVSFSGYTEVPGVLTTH